MSDPKAKAPNPFDAFDQVEEATLTAGPAVTLWDRVRINADEAFRQTTLAGTAIEARDRIESDRKAREFEALPDRRPVFRYLNADGTANADETASPYDAFGNPLPVSIDGQGALEGLAALAGQIGGMSASPENLLGAGFGKWLLQRAGVEIAAKAVTPMAKIVAGAIDAAAVNVGADAAVQGARVATGAQESFDAGQTAVAGLFGVGFGAAVSRWTQRWRADGETAIGAQIAADADGVPAAKAAADGAAPDAPGVGAGAEPVADPLAEPRARYAAALKARDELKDAAGAPAVEREIVDAAQAWAEAVGRDMVDRANAEAARVAGDAAPDAPLAAAETPPASSGQPAPPPDPSVVLPGGIDGATLIERVRGFFSRGKGEAQPGSLPNVEIGRIPADTAEKMRAAAEAAGFAAGDYPNFRVTIEPHRVSHIARSHGSDFNPITVEDFGQIPAILAAPDSISVARNPRNTEVTVFTFTKMIGGEPYMLTLPAESGGKQNRLLVRTLFRDGGRRGALPKRDRPPVSEMSRDPSLDAQGGPEAKTIAPDGPAGNDGPLGRTDGPPAAAAPEGGGAPRSAASPPDGPLASTKTAGRGEPARADAGVASAEPVAIPELVRLHELVDTLRQALSLPVVRQGRFSIRGSKGGKVLGQYASRTGVIRVLKRDDFSTLAHEAGHHLETQLGPELQALMKAHEAELRALDYQPNRPDVRIGRKEGLAEYLRLAMTNPAYGANAAPGFDAAFRAMLARDNPALGRTLDDMAVAFNAWIQQPSREAVVSGIVSARKPGWVEASRKALGGGFKAFAGTIADGIERAYDFFIDDLGGLGRSVRALAEIYNRNHKGARLDLADARDPYKLARMARGAGATATSWLQHGVTGYRSLDRVSPSLRDAIIVATGARNALMPWDDGMVQQFGAYLWSRRALGEWERFARGEIPNPPDKFTKGDHAVAVAEFERDHPQFKQAAPMVHAFARALWDLKRDAGLITADQHAEGIAIRDYVPGQRRFDEDERGGGGGGGNDGKGDVVKRFRGSTRDVINPLDSLMADAFQTASMIARNEAVRSMASLARMAGTGAGAIAEAIPVRELRGMRIDPIETAELAAAEAGLGKADTIALRDLLTTMLGDTKATVFRPAVTNANGEPIVFYREAGELKALRLADGRLGRDMMAAFNQMTRGETDLFIRFLAIPAQVLRTGITTDPAFILANGVRDLAQSVILYGRPFERVRQLAAGGADELLQRDAVKAYNALGGIMGGATTAELRGLMVERDLRRLRKRGWAAQRLTSFKGLLEATELSETATRVGLMRTFKDEAVKRGLNDYEATFEAVWRARDYIDFDRRGFGMAVASRLIPFLNASIQGLDKVGRHTIRPLFAKQLTGEDGRELAMAAKTWAYLGMVTVASVSLTALQGDDWEREEISDTTRATHWTIKFGDKFLAIPKPFEFAAVFNGADALYNAFVKNEPGQVGRFLDDLWEVTAPPSLLQGNPLIATAYELNTGVNLYTGDPIVPEQVQGLEPFMQWTAKTSELSKWIGRQLDVSPAVADHLITRYLGSWGSNALALTDWASGAKGAPGWDDMAVVRRFVKDEARGARSVSAFFDLVARTNGSMSMAAATYKDLASGDPREAADFLADKDDATRIYVTAAMMDVEVRRAHPMFRARDAVSQISKVRREIVLGTAKTADGEVAIGAAERTAADDILADLAMVEARNALILIGAPGWQGKPLVDPSTYTRELKAVSPGAYQALADRFATARVRRFDLVAPAYGELSARLRRDGSDALTDDLTGETKGGGTELDGTKIGREDAPDVPGTGGP